MPEEEFQRDLTKTILQLRMRSPFFATLALFAKMIVTHSVPTAATDGRDVFINPDFWGKLSSDERLGVMAHEVLHAALLHVQRRGTREPILWNIAADIVINGIILQQPDFKLPKGHVRDEKLEHLSAEEIYHLISTGSIQYELPNGDLIYTDDLVSQYGELERNWRQALQHARNLAQSMGQGNLPAGLPRELANLSPSQLDWKSYLWRFLVQTPTDFQNYDRRFIGHGLYLETLDGQSVRVYIAVDTSGSIEGKMIDQFLGEVVGILSAYPHLEAQLYYVDAEAHGPYELKEGAELPRPVGGGGTDFRPFFEKVDSEHEHQQQGVCVYLTDGYGSFPEEAPVLSTLWVLTPGGLDVERIPFGESIRLIPDL